MADPVNPELYAFGTRVAADALEGARTLGTEAVADAARGMIAQAAAILASVEGPLAVSDLFDSIGENLEAAERALEEAQQPQRMH